jgi:hypothetical protein
MLLVRTRGPAADTKRSQDDFHCHIPPDWIDRRPDGSEIFADLDQERRHVFEMCALALYEGRIKCEANLAAASRDRTRETISFRFNASTIQRILGTPKPLDSP